MKTTIHPINLEINTKIIELLEKIKTWEFNYQCDCKTCEEIKKEIDEILEKK